ncbi:hypothetical protein [Sphingobacterium litopenaei]|uniref:Tetratricopeptide repeat protein n=1 Tax=Sphingobacterium litopenaei TaxID=2763500 RepID=A0ABR7YF21_9SPHI|nr:hypothetical protein [Sphingobacterium litopenaei]MBD1429918.1 hypothetical protein [Sphingobacterium litopenaei]
MTTLNNSYHLQYKQALQDPTQLTEEDLLGFLLKYPYSQPLVFAYERRKKLLNQESPNKELALLYAHSESWLMNYVNKPIHADNQEVPRFVEAAPVEHQFVAEEITPKEEIFEEKIVDFIDEETASDTNEDINNSEVDVNLEAPIEEEESAAVEDLSENLATEEEMQEQIDEFSDEASNQEIAAESKEEVTQEVEDQLEIDRLVHEGGVIGDYFAFDSFENKENKIVEEETSPAVTVPEEKEDVSLYNDDLMPYSFRWWLHKTRLEHADTYQPYAVANVSLAPAKPAVDFGKIEDSILDQQIKENIIHFQDPEEKLSEEVKKKPVVPVPPKKGAEIIEKFIQKDPIIQPPSPENINNENMARQSAEDNYVLVTETLANIYIDQGLYLKAIEVFKKLILKYPEKKSYFATRIEELEKNL